MPQITKIIVYVERVAAELMEKYPSLTKIAAPAAAGFIVQGSATALKDAKAWLERSGHKHQVHEA
jgi:hypothetical protein